MKKIDPNSKNVAVRQTGWVQDWRKNDKRNIDLDLNFHGHLSISLLIYIPVNKGGVFSADYSFIMTIYTVSNNSFFKAWFQISHVWVKQTREVWGTIFFMANMVNHAIIVTIDNKFTLFHSSLNNHSNVNFLAFCHFGKSLPNINILRCVKTHDVEWKKMWMKELFIIC